MTTQGATGLLSIVNTDNTSVLALLPRPSALGKAFCGRQFRWTHVDTHVPAFHHRTRSPECKTFASWRLLLPSGTNPKCLAGGFGFDYLKTQVVKLILSDSIIKTYQTFAQEYPKHSDFSLSSHPTSHHEIVGNPKQW